MELDITWKRTIRIWWSYLWRNLIAIIASMLIGGIVGFIIGFILGAIGVAPKTIQLIVMPISFTLGLAISIIPLKMILGKNFGEFRLVLLSTNPPALQNPNKE